MIRMKIIIITWFFLLFSINGFSQVYPFDSIPDNMKKGADAVVRSEQCLYTVTEPGHATEKIKKAITILNENADSYRYLAVMYDKYSKVNYIKGTVFDEKGIVVKSMGAQDVFDMSAITGGSFYSDDRMKVMRFPINKYPFTIEYEYEVSYTSLINYPSWSFQESRDISVEKSGIQFVFPKDIKLRYYEQSLKNKVDSVILDDKKIYTWQENNIPALSSLRPMARSAFSRPVLYAAPLEFEYAGFKGSMSTWKSFGDWVYAINKDRDALPESEVAAIKSIASKYPGQRDQVKAIYEYLQSKTRYVSIQIGIGGYRTAEASAVAKNGFGDCKALVNYTMALLKSAGIKSYYTLVYAGDGAKDINTRFVNNQFNHAILCVPLESDTVWLECTSQALPFNYLGSFTCDRHVLVITPEGGKIVRTPEFKKEQNVVKRTGSVFVNILGTSSARYSVNYAGYYYGFSFSSLSQQSEGEMKRELYASLSYPDFSITSAKYSEQKSENPTGNFQYEASIKGFGIAKGQRIYFNPSFSMEDFLPKDTFALKIPVSDITIDSITYYLPIGYLVESMPERFSVESEFGSYSYDLKSFADKIILYRRLELNKGLITTEKFNDFRKFYNSVARTDRGMIILNRQVSN
jgi:transglutaminase-like putative cysteine protease